MFKAICPSHNEVKQLTFKQLFEAQSVLHPFRRFTSISGMNDKDFVCLVFRAFPAEAVIRNEHQTIKFSFAFLDGFKHTIRVGAAATNQLVLVHRTLRFFKRTTNTIPETVRYVRVLHELVNNRTSLFHIIVCHRTRTVSSNQDTRTELVTLTRNIKSLTAVRTHTRIAWSKPPLTLPQREPFSAIW